MRFLMADLEERSGLTSRTIRDYIKLGYLAPPNGHGPAASYDEEQLLRVVTIARMRARRAAWDEIADFLVDSTVAELRAFVKKTDPATPPPAAASSPAAGPSPTFFEPEVLDRGPVRRGLPPNAPPVGRGAALEVDLEEDEPLDGGVGFVVVNVLPGLALMVRGDASPMVRRVAKEMVKKYSAR